MPAKRASKRPRILVLAGVNGAGKSSVIGSLIEEKGTTWFNPDDYSRGLAASGVAKDVADADAWAYGKKQLEEAIKSRTGFAFETTLGGDTIPQLLTKAANTHDVAMVFCGLDSVERHIARVKQRVAHGGHDIPEERIRQRWAKARENLIALIPLLSQLQVFDNSRDVAAGADIPPPVLVLEMKGGKVIHPDRNDAKAMAAVPEWAKAIAEAAFRASDAG